MGVGVVSVVMIDGLYIAHVSEGVCVFIDR